MYAVCRKCAEVHLTGADPAGALAARAGAKTEFDPWRREPPRSRRRPPEAEPSCPRCARRALLAAPAEMDASPSSADEGDGGAGPRAEPLAIGASARRSRRFVFAAAVLGAYLLAVLGLLAAVLLGHAEM